MSSEITDKHQVLAKGGVFKEPVDNVENWLNFLTDTENLQPGLPKLSVECISHSGFYNLKIHVSFDEATASLKRLHLELDCADDKAMPVFQETDPQVIAARSADVSYTASNPHHLKDWIFGLFKQRELEYLSVRFLNAELPDLFDQLPKLNNINLYRSSLRKLPPSFYRLTALAVLDIQESKIPEVPSELGQLKSLRAFVFSQPCSPAVLASLRGLSTLDCKCRKFEIPAEITQLTGLKQLSFRDAASAPDGFLNFPKLELLNFHVSKDHVASNFTQADVPVLKKLTTNYPAAFATSISHFKSLEHFVTGDQFNLLHKPMQKSELDTLTRSLSQVSTLTHLTLSGLGITDIEFCLSLVNLKSLDLSANAIVDVPAGLGLFQNLERLSLRKNKIVRLPSDLNRLYESDSLDLKDNSIVDFPDLNFRNEMKKKLIRKGGSHTTNEPFGDWLTFLTNPMNLEAGLPDVEIRTDLIYFEDGSIKISFDQHKASLRSLTVVLPPFDEVNVATFIDDPQTAEADTVTNPHRLKKWIFNLFLNTELEELRVPFLIPELPDQFDKLAKLKSIDLSGSKIVRLPSGISQVPALKIVNGPG